MLYSLVPDGYQGPPLAVFAQPEVALELGHELHERPVLHLRQRERNIVDVNVDDEPRRVPGPERQRAGVALESGARTGRLQDVLVRLQGRGRKYFSGRASFRGGAYTVRKWMRNLRTEIRKCVPTKRNTKTNDAISKAFYHQLHQTIQ